MRQSIRTEPVDEVLFSQILVYKKMDFTRFTRDSRVWFEIRFDDPEVLLDLGIVYGQAIRLKEYFFTKVET